MIINRNNYENFFLLYVDGELCAADRKATEDFAAANPDLLQELNILKETVLQPEEIEFTAKSSLYKAVAIDEHIQEKLLLLVDDELSEKEKVTAFSLIAAEPEVATEFALLLRTKSDPDEQIIFAEKHLLYRREKDNVVIGRFAKWAVAAVLPGFGLFFGITLLINNKSSQSPVAVIKNAPVKEGKMSELPAEDTQNNLAKIPEDAGPKDDAGKLQPINSIDKTAFTGKTKIAVVPIAEKNMISMPQEVESVQEARPIVKKETPEEPALKSNPERLTLIAAVAEQKKSEAPSDNNIVPLENTYAKAVSFNEEERSGNKILYMDEDDVKRSKIGGVFRKIKRFVERTAKIKTGNSLKIAGFEFAAK
ncbi:MAG: hypothetical protein WKF88_01090 [Ferruginibacter sp.]